MGREDGMKGRRERERMKMSCSGASVSSCSGHTACHEVTPWTVTVPHVISGPGRAKFH